VSLTKGIAKRLQKEGEQKQAGSGFDAVSGAKSVCSTEAEMATHRDTHGHVAHKPLCCPAHT